MNLNAAMLWIIQSTYVRTMMYSSIFWTKISSWQRLLGFFPCGSSPGSFSLIVHDRRRPHHHHIFPPRCGSSLSLFWDVCFFFLHTNARTLSLSGECVRTISTMSRWSLLSGYFRIDYQRQLYVVLIPVYSMLDISMKLSSIVTSTSIF